MDKGLKILLLSVLLATPISCGNDDDVDCTTALPPPNWFELGFFDTSGQPLIGTVYLQDEFRVFNDNSEIFLSPVPFGNPNRLQVRYEDFDSNLDYYIELTAQDVDTLRFIFESTQGPCFLINDLQQVIYNGESLEIGNSNLVELIKE